MILNIIHVVTVNFMLQYGQLGGFKGGGDIVQKWNGKIWAF